MNGLPCLDHDLGAVCERYRHHVRRAPSPLLVRLTALAGATVSLVASLLVYYGYDRTAAASSSRAAGAGAVARHQLPSSPSTA